MDCGPTCLRMIAKYYGRNFKLQTLKQLSEISREGASLFGISSAAEKIGFRTLGAKLNIEALLSIDLPCIMFWQQQHFVVLYKIKNGRFFTADPAVGLINYEEEEFLEKWCVDDNYTEGIGLILSPKPEFYNEDDTQETDEVKWSLLFKYLVKYKNLVIQLLLGLGIGTILQLIVPLLTQSIVDIGISTRNLNFVYVIISAQLALIVGRVSIDFIRSWILLHVSTRLNISILTDFLIKLMKLPMSFFDSRMTGDIMQRMEDQKRIETFLTGSTLNTIFSVFNLVIFSLVLSYYNIGIFITFSLSTILYTGWLLAFMKRRRDLDYKKFDIAAKNQSNIVQLVSGMQEIKLNNCEQQKRWEWEYLQAKLFKFNVRSLALSQYQQGGAAFINELTNVLITLLSAKAVIDGNLTLGAMVAVQYIVGQLNSPIQQFLAFLQNYQDAKISLERLNEIHQMPDEEPYGKSYTSEIPLDKTLTFNNVRFGYPGNEPILENLQLSIPEGKMTAIVGMSGSGKTTILKLLLRFYEPISGDIRIGNQALTNISFRTWRDQCGIVMQDGFIFSDTIERNIAVGDDYPDRKKIAYAIQIANIQDFIDKLPLGIQTKIGAEGNGVSQGQRQRILIARAVYKNPEYIFFDEATNALDSTNEMVIMNNLNKFFKGKTVLVVAHRLSTVKDADNIILLSNGRIKEQGTHDELTSLKGNYYDLVKNQLELGT